jgi:hypothetical protein
VAALFDADNYARYRISFNTSTPGVPDMSHRDMPCFIHRRDGDDELLWGATYRITEWFMKTTFDYAPPATASLPVIHRRLGRHYLKGASPNG